jgi:hypothetical protein
MAAFAAAKNGAFTLVVDCPVRLHSGLAVDRGIFIDNSTSVAFTATGKFFVDNMFHPAFVIANSSNIVLTNWNVEWDGVVPIDPNFGGYELAGTFVPSGGITQPAAAFNDLVLTKWLATNRAVVFDPSQGWIKSVWVGGVNPAAVFFITGDSYNIAVTGMKLSVPSTVGADHFMPMAFSLSANWKSSQTVNGKTPATARYQSVPHGLTFSGVTLDGTLMGWQGNVQNTMFENINSRRYADLQDANGANVGGIGKWFPPPHLFYLNYNTAGDPLLFNSNIHFESVLDAGPRLGVARDKGGGDTVSGYALSLKLGCRDCSVDHYGSTRPDGFMDVLPSAGLTVSNVFAAFDSEFLNNVFPAGIRFPSTGYTNVTFENVTLMDTAASTIKGPISNATSTTNARLVFSNVQVIMNRWSGSNLPLPLIAGSTNDISLTFDMTTQLTEVSHLLSGTVSTTLTVNPTVVNLGAATLLAWQSTGTSGCMAGGLWSGSVGTSGTRAVKIGQSGQSDFDLTCQNAADSASATSQVTTH